MKSLFVICGKARAGKTTVAEHLTRMVQARGVEFTYGETSSVLVDAAAAELGISSDVILADKETHRPRLIELGNAICEGDPAALARTLFSAGHSVVTGVRRLGELRKLREDFPGIVVLWVERDVPLVRDNREIEPVDCDVFIDNNGPLSAIDEAIIRGLTRLQLLPDTLSALVGRDP